MTKHICREWLKNLFVNQNIGEISSEKPNFLLFLDSYAAHWHKNLDNCIDQDKISVTFHKIPENTTPYLQPLDKMFNHELKFFIRKFENQVIIDNLDIKVHDRFNLMKFWSLVWEQLTSEKFKDLIKFCFENSFCNKSIDYKHVRDVCFISDQLSCQIHTCNNDFFIKCSICEISLCLTHFFIEFHNHRNIKNISNF